MNRQIKSSDQAPIAGDLVLIPPTAEIRIRRVSPTSVVMWLSQSLKALYYHPILWLKILFSLMVIHGLLMAFDPLINNTFVTDAFYPVTFFITALVVILTPSAVMVLFHQQNTTGKAYLRDIRALLPRILPLLTLNLLLLCYAIISVALFLGTAYFIAPGLINLLLDWEDTLTQLFITVMVIINSGFTLALLQQQELLYFILMLFLFLFLLASLFYLSFIATPLILFNNKGPFSAMKYSLIAGINNIGATVLLFICLLLLFVLLLTVTILFLFAYVASFEVLFLLIALFSVFIVPLTCYYAYVSLVQIKTTTLTQHTVPW